MEVLSLGWRTDLMIRAAEGSQISDRDDCVVVRAPANPAFWWGNSLLFPDLKPGSGGEWLDRFTVEFPEAAHVALGVDTVAADAVALEELTNRGLEVDRTAVLTANAVNPPSRVNAEAVMLDFSQPVAVILSLVLHFIPDDAEASAIVATLRDELVPGSHLVISHTCRDGQPEMISSFEKVYNHRVSGQFRTRARDEIGRLCDGFTLLDPGLTWVPQWRPDSPGDVPPDPAQYWVMAGVARYDGPASSH